MAFLWFALGGYLVPAALDAINIALFEMRQKELSLTEILVTAILGGLTWPARTIRYEPKG